jgi:hypothetical protein
VEARRNLTRPKAQLRARKKLKAHRHQQITPHQLFWALAPHPKRPLRVLLLNNNLQ